MMVYINASLKHKKAAVENKHDSLVRESKIILDIAHELSIIPDSSRVIRITGSKGKGTTSRIISNLLRAETGKKVGLFVSPEEIDHNDRMRINGRAPSKEEVVAIFNKLKPFIGRANKNICGDRYISPFGTLLLLALWYFKENKVKYFVLECGRGAKHDEVGNINSKVSVITSIFFEHSCQLGPKLEDIADNKLFIGTNSYYLVCDEDVARWNDRRSIFAQDKIILAEGEKEDLSLPNWLASDNALARTATRVMLGRNLIGESCLKEVSASFGIRQKNGSTYYYEACININSVDRKFINTLVKRNPNIVFLASLPDDKDIDGGVREYFTSLTKNYFEIALFGPRMGLTYHKIKSEESEIEEIQYEDIGGLNEITRKLSKKYCSNCIYYIGTQTYIRLAKMAIRAI